MGSFETLITLLKNVKVLDNEYLKKILAIQEKIIYDDGKYVEQITVYTHIIDNSHHLIKIINKNIMLLSHIQHNKTVLMMLITSLKTDIICHGCKKTKTIFEIIRRFGPRCRPEHVDGDGNTMLMISMLKNVYGNCIYCNSLKKMLLNTFGEKCNVKNVNNKKQTAMSICEERKLTQIKKLLEKF